MLKPEQQLHIDEILNPPKREGDDTRFRDIGIIAGIFGAGVALIDPSQIDPEYKNLVLEQRVGYAGFYLLECPCIGKILDIVIAPISKDYVRPAGAAILRYFYERINDK